MTVYIRLPTIVAEEGGGDDEMGRDVVAAVAKSRSRLWSTATIAASIVVGAMVSGCQLAGREGAGPPTSETRETSAFRRIEVGNGIGLTVQIGDTQELEVRAQENLLPIIATDVEGDSLRIRSMEGFQTSERVEVVITAPTLEAVKMSGGSQGKVDGLETDRLAIELSGGSGLTATGSAIEIVLDMTGGSRATLEGLDATTMTVNLSGGATATVRASEWVTGEATGGSRLTVSGDARLDVEATGGSQVMNG